MMFISKDAQYYDRSYCIHEFFIMRFLVFELLLIFYFTEAYSDLGRRRSVAGKQRSVAFCKILKYSGPGGGAPGGECGEELS